jgi:hypothetical protein
LLRYSVVATPEILSVAANVAVTTDLYHPSLPFGEFGVSAIVVTGATVSGLFTTKSPSLNQSIGKYVHRCIPNHRDMNYK